MSIEVEEIRVIENHLELAGYTIMTRGGTKQLNPKQESMLMEVALLANDYERLKAFIH